LANGNVGIGTTLPNSLLDISYGNTYIHGAGSYSQIGGIIKPYIITGVVGGLQINSVQTNGTEISAISISDSGYVGIGTSIPLQPLHVFGAVKNKNPAFYATSHANIASSTNTKITNWDSVWFNEGNGFNASLSRFIAPISGRYYVSFSGMSVSNETPVYSLKKNGSYYGAWTYGPAVLYSRGAMSWIVELNVGDYIEIWLGSSRGQAGSIHPEYNAFIGYYIG
jgi:C1q domain